MGYAQNQPGYLLASHPTLFDQGEVHVREPFNAASWLVDRNVQNGLADSPAIYSQGRTYTYGQVQAKVQQASGALSELGVRPEERVLMVMLDGIDFVSVFLGAMRIGAVPVPVNPLLPGRDVAVIAADARAAVAVVSGQRAVVVADLQQIDSMKTILLAGEQSEGYGAPGDGVLEWAAVTERVGSVDAYPTWEESPGFWLCTSGSTGQPKLAMHRHGDIKYTCDTYAVHVLEANQQDTFFSVGPMFHAYGLGNSLTFPFSVGATAVLEPTRPPTPQLVAELMHAHKPTLFFCIPTFYAALNASELASNTFDSVRWAVSAAEALPAESYERFLERFGVRILDGIGSTELLHIYLSNNPDQAKPGTSGVPVPGYQVRIVDEDGVDVTAGEPGELLAAGDSMATGYWCRSETTRATFEGRWMHTGDLYRQDDDGFYTYMGRVDDMLRVGGEWVSPTEVEATLIEHENVLEAAVVGERDEAAIVRPVAYVVPSGSPPSGEELASFCQGRLAGFKRPRRYEIVEELPKTATGKIQRFRLREESA